MDGLKSLPQISRDSGVAIHRLSYAVLSRHIEPDARVSRVRLYNDQTAKRIIETAQDISKVSA